MPWRQDSPPAFWLDPNPSLSGIPDAVAPAHVQPARATSRQAVDDVRFAVITVSDRIGFQYRRVVGLNDFVSQRDAAQLLDVPLMTVTRWTASRRLRGRAKNGFTVIRLRDLLNLIDAENRPLRTGRLLATVHAAANAGSRIASEIIFTSTRPTRARSERKR
jgi:hypothetical protein